LGFLPQISHASAMIFVTPNKTYGFVALDAIRLYRTPKGLTLVKCSFNRDCELTPGNAGAAERPHTATGRSAPDESASGVTKAKRC
ncbi:MAG TPA: hypothetical protein VN788_13180, partial [Verrucomicrobiae bacterium]|nr:hypothetical protein [Verrucomicrobiae bacterium]